VLLAAILLSSGRRRPRAIQSLHLPRLRVIKASLREVHLSLMFRSVSALIVDLAIGFDSLSSIFASAFSLYRRASPRVCPVVMHLVFPCDDPSPIEMSFDFICELSILLSIVIIRV
jgi:hypothetical protein